MAAARDQAARIIRSEPDAAGGETPRATLRRLAEQLRAHLSDETARRPAEAPASPTIEKPAVERPAAAPSAAAGAAPKSGKRKLVLMGLIALLALAAAGYGVHYFLVGRFYMSHRRRLCARQQHHARRAGVGTHRGDPSRRQRAGPHRRGDLQDRRRRLSYRGGRRAHQDRDPAGHHRPDRPPGHRAGKRGRAGQGASWLPRKPA